MSEREIEIRGTKWEFDCNFGSWCRSDRPLVSKRPVSDAIEEVIALRKRIAEVESDRDGWRSDCQRQGGRQRREQDSELLHREADAQRSPVRVAPRDRARRLPAARGEAMSDGNLTLAVWAKEGGYALKLRYDNGGVVVTIVSHDGETFRDVATMTVEAYRCRRVADFFLGKVMEKP